jgi:hypothetical protein
MFDRQLAKWHLEQQGYLAAVDVHLTGQGSVDVFGIKIGDAGGDAAVFGVVRGWWHAGAYLTPSLLRTHLQTDRRLLDKAFAGERLGQAAVQFGLSREPEKVLFYSKRSPSLAAGAEQELALLGARVVYLEDILADALAQVKYDDKLQGTVLQALAMVKSSRIFKVMARLARQAERKPGKKERAKPIAAEPTVRQLDLLLSFDAEEDEDAVDPT